jgi:hypothetical protein
MVYKPLAMRVALIAGFRQAMPVFRSMIVVAVSVVMWKSLRDFQGVWEEWKAGPGIFHGLFLAILFCGSQYLCVKSVIRKGNRNWQNEHSTFCHPDRIESKVTFGLPTSCRQSYD